MAAYTFDVVLTGTITVPDAVSRRQAELMLKDCLRCADANLGAWPNDSPILAELGLDGEPDFVGRE